MAIDDIRREAEAANKLRDIAKDTLSVLKEEGEQWSKLGRVSKLVTNQVESQSKLGQDAIKLEEILYKIKLKLGGTQDKILESLFEGAKKLKEQGKISSKLAEIQKKAKNAFKSQVLQGGLLIGVFMALKKLAFGFAGKIDEVGKTFGVMAADDSFVKGLTTAEESAIELGLGLTDVISTISTLSSEFGVSLGEATKLSATIFDTALATGLSVDESTKLFGSLKSIVGLSNEEAEYLTESTHQLAKQKGVAPAAVLKDMAGSAEAIAKYTDETGQNIAEAAVQARQLGVSFDTTTKIADNLTEFQSSIQAELEASVMTGKQLNLQKARELALTGDLSSMMEEVVSQLGSAEEIERMLPIQRQSLAKAIGVSTAELMKFTRGTKDLSVSGALAAGEFNNLVGADAISGISNLTNKFKAFMAQVVNVLGPTFDNVATIMSNWLGPGGKMTDELTTKFESFGKKVEEFFKGIFKPVGENSLSLWDGIGQIIKSLPETFGVVGSAIRAIIPAMISLKIATVSYALASLAATAFKAGGFAGPFAPLAIGAVITAGVAAWGGIKALSSFQDLPPGLGADLGGAALVHPQGTFGKETVLHTEEITDEMKLLRQEMKSYFGFGGTAIKGIGRENVSALERTQ